MKCPSIRVGQLAVCGVLLIVPSHAPAAEPPSPAGIRVGNYLQDVATVFAADDGLTTEKVHAVAVTEGGTVYAGTDDGLFVLGNERWAKVPPLSGQPVTSLAADNEGLWAIFATAVHRWHGGRAERVAELPAAAAGLDEMKGHRLFAAGELLLATDAGLFQLQGDQFVPLEPLQRMLGETRSVRGVAAGPEGQLAVAADAGLFLRAAPGAEWQAVYPRDGSRSWAPRDLRGVAFDPQGRLWFASPQGAGCFDGQWKLYTGADGLPYDDFTDLAASRDGTIWFGTRRGAICFREGQWNYRQGRRWVPDDDLRDVTVSPDGDAWFATPAGVGRIERQRMTLADKARFFEDEIDLRHRRTPYGYVGQVTVERAGDKSRWTNHDSDNDGLWTSMYGAGECYAYAATRSPDARRRARQAFEALRFLGTVTQGGSNPAPRGFVARTILPTSGHDPNAGSVERDRRIQSENERLWKVIDPRWPTSADGKWYWKSDTSSDELDGHYFFYPLYYDLVAESDEEKAEVRRVVVALTDHLIEHGMNLVDHDGRPTRWGHYGPQDLNHSSDWWIERGLNSLSMLAYLKVAEHVSGDSKYADVARELIETHGYAQNVTYPKAQSGPGTGNQSDDEMAFMGFYNLLKYEADPELRAKYAYAFYRYWQLERPELNPLFNFMYAAVCRGAVWTDAYRSHDLSPRGAWLEESIDTLKRFPLDRFDWRHTNSHRRDIVALRPSPLSRRAPRGQQVSGRVVPIDERFVGHWNHSPWQLDSGGNGHTLADGGSFLLPYYMGLYYGFVVE